MNKQDVTKFFKGVQATLNKRSPEILTAIGIVSAVTTTVLAVKATPKALQLMEEAEKGKKEELTKVEVVKVAWKPYIPAAVTGVFSVGCLIGAHSVHAKRNAALATAYQLSTTALNEYREKVVEAIGEKKEIAVHDKLAKDHVEKNPPAQSQSPIILTDKGNTLCYDAHSDRYFRSDIDSIRRAILDLNEKMINGSEYSISLNEYYHAIGLPQTQIGESLGWRIDKGKIEVHFSAQLLDDHNPCIVLEYLTPPEYGFNDVY